MQRKLPNEAEEQIAVATKESQFFDVAQPADDTIETQALRTLCRTMPRNFEALIVLGDSLGLQKRYTEAIVVVNRAIDLAPRSPVGYRRRALLERMCLRFEKSQFDFAYSQELDPEQTGICCELGISAYMTAQYAQAKACLESAIAQADELEEPEQRWIARYWAVLASSNLGDSAEVAALLENFSEQEPAAASCRPYCKAMRLFAGCCDLEAMLRFVNTETDDFDYVTELYAVCIWLEANQRWGEAAELRQTLLSRDRAWDCPAYLAAAADAEWNHME